MLMGDGRVALYDNGSTTSAYARARTTRSGGRTVREPLSFTEQLYRHPASRMCPILSSRCLHVRGAFTVDFPLTS